MSSLQKQLQIAELNAKKRDEIVANGGLSNEETAQLIEQINSSYKKLEDAGFQIYKTSKKKTNSKIHFTQIIHVNINYLIEQDYLTMSEESFLLRISSLIGYQSNGLIKLVDGIQRPLTQEEIAKSIKRTRQKVNPIIKQLIEKGIMARTESSLENNNVLAYAYFINPNIMLNGDKNNINDTLRLIFQKANRNKILKNLPIKLF